MPSILSTASESARESFRTITGSEFRANPALVDPFLVFAARVKELDAEHSRRDSYAQTPAERTEAQEWWCDAYDAAKAERDRALAAINGGKQLTERLRALHETRDEAAEAHEAARAMRGGQEG